MEWRKWGTSIAVPAALLAVALLAVAAGPAAADWLVTRDGARFEIRGAWEVRGGSIVFKTLNGTLSSMSVEDVDLDKSAELTAAKKAPPAAEETAAPKPAVRTIGPEDVPSARRPSAGRPGAARSLPDPAVADAGAAGGEETPAGAAAFADRLEITTWRKNEPSWLEGVEVVGQITNRGESTAADLSLEVTIYDDRGRPLATERAFLESRSLLRGQTLDFRVPFEGVADFETVEFGVSATAVVLGVGAIDQFDETRDYEGETTNESGR